MILRDVIKRISEFFEARRQGRRSSQFIDDIERYRREVLAAAELGFGNDTRIVRKRKRSIYVGSDQVWKFYRTSRRDSRNFVAASEILEKEGIEAPRIIYSDLTSETRDRFRLSCVVMNCVAGKPLSEFESETVAPELGRFLGQLHSVHSPTWGECHDLKTEALAESYLLPRLAKGMAEARGWCAENGVDLPPDSEKWLSARTDQLEPSDGQFSFVSSDPSADHFFLSPDGTISMIDLDRSRFLFFASELAIFMVQSFDRERHGSIQDPEELLDALEAEEGTFFKAYFLASPAETRAEWKRVRRASCVAQAATRVAHHVRSLEAKRVQAAGGIPEEARGGILDGLTILAKLVES